MRRMKYDFGPITKLIDNYQNWYWNSDFDDINLIEDLRLKTNVNETAHSRILFKLLKSGRRYGYPLWQELVKLLGWNTNNATAIGPPEKYNIDLLIEGFDSFKNKFAVIIENKINRAKDQDRQIERYIESLKDKEGFDESQIYVLYVTKGECDDGPSENSFSKDRQKEFASRYRKISYQKEIRNWIESCKKIWINDLIRSVLVQYGTFLTSMYETNKEKEMMIDKNIDKWCFDSKSSQKSLSEIYDALKSRKESMQELVNDMGIFYRDSVIQKMKERGIEAVCADGNINFVWFKIPYHDKDNEIILKGHFNFREDIDGGIWYGIDSNFENNTIFTFDGKQIDGKKATEICDKIKKKFPKSHDLVEDGSPYICWKFIDDNSQAIEEIVDYINK